MNRLQDQMFTFLPVSSITLLCLIIVSSYALPATIQIGGLFDVDRESEQESAFSSAINSINLDETLLRETRLSPAIERVTRNNSFRAFKSGESTECHVFCFVCVLGVIFFATFFVIQSALCQASLFSRRYIFLFACD